MPTSNLSMTITKIWLDDWNSFDELQSHNALYGDLQILVDGKLLAGTEEIVKGETSLGIPLKQFMRLRRYKEPPIKYESEIVELSGYEYTFEYPVVDGPDLLEISVAQDGEPVPGFERIKFELQQVQTELRRFRQQMQELLLQHSPKGAAERWWEGNLFEDFDDSKNTQGKY